MFSLSQSSKDHRKGISPRLIEISDVAIGITLVDFGHGKYAGLRTPEIQNELFLKGLSKCDGYVDLSKHQSGNALDFYAYVGKASWEHHHLVMVAMAFMQAAMMCDYKIETGVLWKPKTLTEINGIIYGWDCPHVQLVD